MNNSGEPLSSRLDGPARIAVSDLDVVRPASAAVSARQTALIYGTVAAAIIVAMSPALFFSFGFHNDYNQWSYDSHTCCLQYPETNMLIDIGRYFGAFAQNLQSFTIHTLDDLWRWRLIGILSVAGLAVYYLYIVSLRRPPTWQNACLSVAIFTLPTMQWQAIWVAMYVFWTPPILLALVAAHLLVKAADCGVLVKVEDRDSLADRPAPWRFARLVLLASTSVLTACFFYPMSATFVVVPAAHLLLCENKRQFRLTALCAAAVLGGAIIGLFVIHKYVVLPHLSDVPYLGNYGYGFAGNLVTEVLKRLSYYLREGAYLWVGVEIAWFPVLASIGAVVGAGFLAFRIYRRSVGVGELINLALACALFFVAVAPVLVVGQFSSTYRIRLAMNAIELLVFFWLLGQLPISHLRLAVLFATVGLSSTAVDVYGMAADAGMEYAIYSKATANLSAKEFHSIAILRPSWRGKQIFGLSLRNDFGLSASPAIFDLLIGPRYRNEATFSVTEMVLPPTGSLSAAIERNINTLPLAIEEDLVIVDASPIYGEPNFKNILGQLATISARPIDTRPGYRFGVANAVDGNVNTPWEVAGVPFPIELELDFPSPHTLRGYSLSTVEETDRMPSSWEIWVTSDRIDWRRLQQITEDPPWKNQETRHYSVTPTPGVTAMKLKIIAAYATPVLRLYEFRPVFGAPPN